MKVADHLVPEREHPLLEACPFCLDDLHLDGSATGWRFVCYSCEPGSRTARASQTAARGAPSTVGYLATGLFPAGDRAEAMSMLHVTGAG